MTAEAADWEGTRTTVVRDALGVGIATGAYGVTFGAIATTSGLSVGQTCAMSLLIFTGASQFALVGVIAGGGNWISGAFAALLLGSRNMLYGLRLAPTLALRGRERLLGAQFVLDESSAMAFARSDDPAARLAFWSTGLAVFVFWNLATLFGAVSAASLADPTVLGLDAAVPAAFLALLWPRLRNGEAQAAALTAAVVALLLMPVVPVGVPVLAAALVAVAFGLRPARDAEPGVVVIWAAVLVTAAGCYGFKLAGLSVPERVLSAPIVRRVSALLPVVLLAALVGVQTFSTGNQVQVDARLAGVAAAVVALLLRAPFLVVVAVAAVVAAGLRALG